MRRLLRPTGLSRGFTQPQQQQRRYIRKRRPLSNYPTGSLLHEGHGPLKNKIAEFELPDVVLDLDAEDSPHVRRFDAKSDDPLQESQWGYDPVVDEVDREARSMRQSLKSDLTKLEFGARLPFSQTRLSDFDVMTVALSAESTDMVSDGEKSPARNSDTKSERYLELHKRLIQDGIPGAIVGDASKVLPFMLHRQHLTLAALKDPSKRRREAGNDEEELNWNIAHCKNLAQLKRLYSRIDSPESGVEVTSASIDHVHARLLEFLRSGEQRATSADILKFVNNLTIRRLSTDKALNRSMTLFGLQLAADLGVLSSILQYLQICISMGFIASRTEGVTLTRCKVGGALLAVLQRGEGTARGTRQQIFTLLTGRGPDSQAPPQECLFGLLAEDHEQKAEIMELSVTLLGELGALRLLLHHWRQRAKQPGASSRLMENGRQQSQGTNEPDDVFVKAFLRCTQLLAGAKAGEIRVDLTTVTGEVEKDAALDWHNINVVDTKHARRDYKLSEPHLTSLAERIPVDEIKGALNKPDMRATMGRFRELMS